MGWDIAKQEASAEKGFTLHEWEGDLHRYRLRVLPDGTHRIDRQYGKDGCHLWRRMGYPQDVTDEMARLFYESFGFGKDDQARLRDRAATARESLDPGVQ